MKTFKELREGDYIYCIYSNKSVEIAQIKEICAGYYKSGKSVTSFICDRILGSKYYPLAICSIFGNNLDNYEQIQSCAYVTSDESLFIKHLKQIVDEDV